ncbi:aminotransferase class I/II-fold pyridoxal phosphate-dependent enzyme [Thalassomonas sp. M1454]|uniref:aminotransferase class I/II-fold pyridoxal phosphate-dependent enzyme n=1 Tax=Thalassomonas sp. M1454 TaxID=2594477 RepID=UPI00117D81C6|nr:8-amino-7-oxononanoate synthase [Thalassomonas sp. M1454]TRX56859.1 8-amino-7-oxononanoate synthase [Thalassomonas sp. M1454]
MSFNFIREQLAQQKSDNLDRNRVVLSHSTGRLLSFDGIEYINFSSNDYLGLADHSDIKTAYIKGIEKYGTSACSSSLITGYTKAHKQLEENLAQWLNAERCLLFASGFSANCGVLHTLGAQASVGFYLDKLSHASLIDGAFNSKAKSKRFRHNDVTHLDKLLTTSSTDSNLVVTEGVYSMDGDCAPLTQIKATCDANDSWLYIDDAHGIGVLGSDGSGTASEQNLNTDSNVIQMATFGKAIATNGAVVAGNEELIEYFINRNREYIYTTAISPALALATNASVEICKTEHWRREKIQKLTALFKSKLDSSIEVTPTESSIIGVIVGSEINTLYCAQKLKDLGFWLTAIRPPTVENGKSRLRVTITASHNDNDISMLAESINEVIGKCLQNN